MKAPTWSWRELRIGYFSQSLSWESGLLYVFSQIIEVAVALPSSTCLCSASWECPVTWLIWIIKNTNPLAGKGKKKPATHLRVLKHLRKKAILNIEQMVYTEGGRKTSEFNNSDAKIILEALKNTHT